MCRQAVCRRAIFEPAKPCQKQVTAREEGREDSVVELIDRFAFRRAWRAQGSHHGQASPNMMNWPEQAPWGLALVAFLAGSTAPTFVWRIPVKPNVITLSLGFE